MSSKRVILVAVDDSDASVTVLDWVIDNLVKSGDDEIHLFHVIPIPMPEIIGTGSYMMDSVVTVDPDPKEDLKHIHTAKEMITHRFLARLASRQIPYKVEIVHFLTDNDSIGEAICKRSEALNANAVAMAKHQRGKISEMFLGSAAKYVTQHCKRPVIIIHE